MSSPKWLSVLQMAIQMTGGKGTLRMGPSDQRTFMPDLDWLQDQLSGPSPPKLVYVVNPCNPTGGACICTIEWL